VRCNLSLREAVKSVNWLDFMQNLESDRNSKSLAISSVLAILAVLEFVLKIWRCQLGEYYSLFWIHLGFLIFLFYWPIYLSPRFFLPPSELFSGYFRLFVNALVKAAYYLLFVAIALVISLVVFRKGISDSVVFLPLLLFWPVYVFQQVQPDFKSAVLPFVLSVGTIVGIQFTNPANPSFATFNSYLKDFETVVAMVKSGEIKPERDDLLEVELPCQYRYLVGCPNRKIRIEKVDNAIAIYFCQNIWMWGRGREQFVYRSDNKHVAVKSGESKEKLEIVKLRDRWFWQVEDFPD
jgi:hypothetical protein